jgi:hypothetical protein
METQKKENIGETTENNEQYQSMAKVYQIAEAKSNIQSLK